MGYAYYAAPDLSNEARHILRSIVELRDMSELGQLKKAELEQAVVVVNGTDLATAFKRGVDRSKIPACARKIVPGIIEVSIPAPGKQKGRKTEPHFLQANQHRLRARAKDILSWQFKGQHV